jgi:TonB family protein
MFLAYPQHSQQVQLVWLPLIAIALIANVLLLLIGGWVLLRRLGRQSAPVRPPVPPAIQTALRSLAATQDVRVLQGLLLDYRLGNADRDIPDQTAFPRQHQLVFSKIANAPPLRHPINQVIRLRVLVTRTGNVRILKILQSTGSPSLDQIAQRMLRRWPFEPARQNQQPVDSLLDIKLQILLR